MKRLSILTHNPISDVRVEGKSKILFFSPLNSELRKAVNPFGSKELLDLKYALLLKRPKTPQ